MGATDNMLHLNAAAQRALEKVFKSGFEYHRVGVLLHDLVPVKNISGQLFETEHKVSRSPELMWAIKNINSRFGRYTVVSASAYGSSAWRARTKFRSPAFTTCWKELPVVYA